MDELFIKKLSNDYIQLSKDIKQFLKYFFEDLIKVDPIKYFHCSIYDNELIIYEPTSKYDWDVKIGIEDGDIIICILQSDEMRTETKYTETHLLDFLDNYDLTLKIFVNDILRLINKGIEE